MPKPQVNRAQSLIASVTADMLGGDLTQRLQDNTIRVESILLELIRPDPVQPRRVLPERIHFSFHENRLTQTQALRELVQMVQLAARQRGRPFNDILDTVTSSDSSDESELPADLTPEERLLRDLVNLAVTIRDDGQVNPLTVVDVSSGVSHQFRIETGERRYWATWLIRDFFSGTQSDGTIPCIIVPSEKASVFRQAKENTARSGLSAIAMARQAALLLLTAHGYEIPASAVTNDFYRQALELDLRGKREYTDAILSAMGGIAKHQFSRIKALLALSDEALELADRQHLEEGVLRYVVALPSEAQVEMVQQIITFNMTVKQAKETCEQADGDESPDPVPDRASTKLLKVMRDVTSRTPYELAQVLTSFEGSVHLAQARVKTLVAFLNDVERSLQEKL